MPAYYNENDPYAAAWLRNLAREGHIASGQVDDRSVRDLWVDPPGQAHFFAGLGGWSHALRLAGWPDELPVWTGSCPCQPFSQAGRRKGTADERHLWPEWFRLIRSCKPPVVFGEQVANPDGLGWLDTVLSDLEGEGYEVGAADLCAAGVGAPHIRQRLYFVAVARGERRQGLRLQLQSGRSCSPGAQASRCGAPRPVAEPEGARREGRAERGGDAARDRSVGNGSRPADDGGARSLADDLGSGRGPGRSGEARRRTEVEPDRFGDARELGDPGGQGPQERPGAGGRLRPLRIEGPAAAQAGAVRGFWADADLVYCRSSRPGRDGEYRPVEPGSFPLAHGAPARVGRVRAYGNAIVPQVAATFVRAVIDSLT